MELRKLLFLTAIMGIFSTIANDCAAFMTTIAFGIL